MTACGRRQGAFSLVEVLIVLAIVAMLAALAYPFYSRYQAQADRNDATSTLLDTWTELERCFVEELDYRACTDRVPEVTEQGLYELTIDAEVDSFTLTAKPAPGSPQEADEDCARFTLTHKGERGSEPAPAGVCWPD